VLNFRKISADSKGELVRAYFTQDVPESTAATALDVAGRELEPGARLTSYYTGRDARARWRPDMPTAAARAIGIDPAQRPKDAALDLLFEGKRADTGAAWSQHKRQFSGFDLVFSPHKSVSLAAEFASTAAERAAIWHAVSRANDAAMKYLAREIGWARKGKGGEDGANAGEAAWVTFMHDSARPTLAIQDGTQGATYLVDAQIPGDPHLHAHNFLMNMVATDDGRIGSLDTRVLSANRINEFDAYFQAVLADELRKIGAEVGYNAGEQAVAILSIPEIANKTFSKSHDYVLRDAKSYAASQGLDWDALRARPLESNCGKHLGQTIQGTGHRSHRHSAARPGERHRFLHSSKPPYRAPCSLGRGNRPCNPRSHQSRGGALRPCAPHSRAGPRHRRE
jgi:TrwC relaxase